MSKISIIIPIYNSEKYLNRCLNSVLDQTFKDIEIICINDCSIDNSLKILKEYSKKDNRIKIIDLVKNCGVSNARNTGLNNVSSEFVCFLDSDDFLENDFCKSLLKSICVNESDLACCGHRRINILNTRLKPWLPSESISMNPIDDIYLFTKHRNVTQKLFKTSIIRNNRINFSTTLNYMEDALFLVTYLTKCKKITSIKKALYNVQINPNSLCRNIDLIDRREKDREKALAEINKVISSSNKSLTLFFDKF